MSDPPGAVPASRRVFYGPWANAVLGSVKATGDFAEALRKAGYDPLNPADNYPPAVFIHLVDLVRRHLFPDLSPQESWRQMGRRQLLNYFGKGIGRLMGLAFSFLRPEQLIKNTEHSRRAGNNFMKVAAIQEGDRRWRVTYSNTAGFPADYVAGGLEYGLEMGGAPSRKVVVANADPAKETFDLEVTW